MTSCEKLGVFCIESGVSKAARLRPTCASSNSLMSCKRAGAFFTSNSGASDDDSVKEAVRRVLWDARLDLVFQKHSQRDQDRGTVSLPRGLDRTFRGKRQEVPLVPIATKFFVEIAPWIYAGGEDNKACNVVLVFLQHGKSTLVEVDGHQVVYSPSIQSVWAEINAGTLAEVRQTALPLLIWAARSKEANSLYRYSWSSNTSVRI